LKLETETELFWQLTKFVCKQEFGYTDWKEGVVLVESLIPNDRGECGFFVYTAATRAVQYLNFLVAKRDELKKHPFSWERDKEIEETQRKINEFIQKRRI
jgi:hypothetical protein